MQPYQQSSAIPQGPSTSSSSTRTSKLDQIIQNFYTKTAQIVVQARCAPNDDARYGKRTSLKGSTLSTNKKLNKWFTIATEDVGLLRENLKYWRTMAIQTTAEKEPPPMVLEIYLDTSKLGHNQSLVVADDNLRWCFVELKSPTSHTRIERIMIERWELNLKHPFPEHAVDLPSLYKRSIVFFRSLHSLARLLPTYDLYRKLYKISDPSSPLSIGYRLSTASSQQKDTEISLDSTILESDARKPTNQYQFSDIVTPIGTFKLTASYRRNCDFKVEDAERDLSAQFIDMDEQFFTPTMIKYQQQQQEERYRKSGNKSSTRPVSMFEKSRSDNKELSSSRQPQPLDPKEVRSSSSTSSKNFIKNVPPTSASTPTSRRTSAPLVVSPFKSPFLSSSPQADPLFSGSGSGGLIRHSERARPVSTYATSTTGAIASSSGGGGSDQSGSFGRKIEFSSSFDKYKSSPTSRTILGDSPSSASMMRRWSRTSDHSSMIWRNEHEEDGDLEDFVRLVGSNQELRLFQQPNRSTQQLGLSASDSSSSSIMANSTSVNKKTALSHFQNLRETHNSLSDSLSSSMMMGAASSQQQEIVTGISPVSSTSSTGRSYQPIIPSPLHHTEQHSTSPVHIPRSFPQLRSMTHNQNPLRVSRINPPSWQINDGQGGNDNDNEQEREEREDTNAVMYVPRSHGMSECSTYPQDRYHLLHHHRHQHDLHFALGERHTTGHSGHITGTPITSQSGQLPQLQQQGSKLPFRSSDSRELCRSHNTTTGVEGSSSLIMDPSGSGGGSGASNRGNNSSLMDDDDSLVFKMSELECEGPSTTTAATTNNGKQPLQKHEMVFNNRFNNNTHLLNLTNSTSTLPNTSTNNRVNEQSLELTPTPLSSPLLHRLQTISMSTVAEEEEKSSLSPSGSSSKSDSHHAPPSSSAGGVGVAKPSPLPFETW